MGNDNIIYQTEEIARHFAQNRVSWSQFYESERVIIEQLGLGAHSNVLDIGCGCGGLGLALRERFGVVHYTGVEINRLAMELGRRMNPQADIFCGDILDLSLTMLRERRFDVVFSLSCVDWNVRYEDMLAAVWSHVIPGGRLVSTFRLTTKEGCNDFERSYQFINFEGVRKGERAAYVVLNAQALLRQLLEFNPSSVAAYGYWGAPSPTAMTPYEQLCFAAFSIAKRGENETGGISWKLDLPAEILQGSRWSTK